MKVLPGLRQLVEQGTSLCTPLLLPWLLQAVPDPTGREDLVRHLRTRLLLQAAQAAGCNKLLLGDTGTRVATQVIAAAAKGRGYALPADIQWVDARWVPG